MKQLLLLLLIPVLIYLSSCESELSSSVDQDRIYTIYELYYNANVDKTYARAKFKFGNATGTLLELDDPSFAIFDRDSGHPGLQTSFCVL